MLAAAMPVFSFFFQAEDGIRDPLVTGVQTCALPISPCWRNSHGAARGCLGLWELRQHGAAARRSRVNGGRETRSEERRVGKEGGRRWSRDASKKKKDALQWVIGGVAHRALCSRERRV